MQYTAQEPGGQRESNFHDVVGVACSVRARGAITAVCGDYSATACHCVSVIIVALRHVIVSTRNDRIDRLTMTDFLVHYRTPLTSTLGQAAVVPCLTVLSHYTLKKCRT